MKKSELLQFSESELMEIAKAYGLDVQGKNKNEIAELLADEPDSDSSENSSPESTTSETENNQVKDKVEEKVEQKDNNKKEAKNMSNNNESPEVRELKRKIYNLEEVNKSKEKTIQKLQNMYNELRQFIRQYPRQEEKDIEKLIERIVNLEAKKEELKNQLSYALTKNTGNNNTELKKLKQENSELKEKMKKLEGDNYSLQLKLGITIRENKSLKKKNRELDEILEKRIEKNVKLESEIIKLESIIEEYKNTFPFENLRKEIEELKKYDIRRIIIRKKKIQEKEKELIEKKIELEKQLEQIEKEKSEFDEIEKLVSEIEKGNNPDDNNPDDTPPTGTDSPDNKNPETSTNNSSSVPSSTSSVNNSIESLKESAKEEHQTKVLRKKTVKKSDSFKEYIQLVKRLKVDKELPILKNALIEYNKEEKSIKLIATNLNISLESPIFNLSELPENIESGKYLILIDLLKKCKTPDDIFKYIDLKTSVDDFPLPVENKKVINTIAIKDFSLEEVFYKIANNEDNRKILQSFIIDTENSKLVSTDAKRLIYKKINFKECDYTGKIIFPEELAKILQKNFYSEVQINLQENDHAKIVLSNDIKIYSRIKDGNYPNYLQVIPVSFSKTIEIKKSVILEVIEKRKAELIREEKKRNEIAMDNFIVEIDNNIYGKFCIKYIEQILSEAKESVKVLYNKDYIEKEGKNYLITAINIQINNLNYIIMPLRVA